MLKNCRKNKIKDTCGIKYNARCVYYDDYIPLYSSLLDEECITLEETTADIYHILDDIKSEIDLTELGESCITYETEEVGVIKVKEALKTHETEICLLKEALEDLSSTDCCTDITGWGIDTKCLEDECGTGFNSLENLIQAMINKLCDLEALITP